MSKHRDENCQVPFCDECLARIKGVSKLARGLRNSSQSNSKSEDTPHRHRVAKRDVDTRAIFCECGAFLNETGKWLDTEVDYFEVAKYGSANASLPSKLAPEPPQDTSLDEALRPEFHKWINDKLGADDGYISFLENTLLRIAEDWHKAERAKLFEQIRSEVIEISSRPDIYNGHEVRARDDLKDEQLEALTRLEQK